MPRSDSKTASTAPHVRQLSAMLKVEKCCRSIKSTTAPRPMPGARSNRSHRFPTAPASSRPSAAAQPALLDGASHWRIFRSIVLPLAKPALATLGVLSFLTNWNDFLWPVFVLFSPQHLTLPAGLSALESSGVTNYPIMMAGAVVASIPAIALFVLAQRFIIAGISRTGLKG
jgi:multiple sugar transport system permease protein